MSRFYLAIALVLGLTAACSTSNVRKEPEGSKAAAEGDIQAAADRMIDLVNARDYGALLDSFSAKCAEGTSRDQLTDSWKKFGEQIGDPDFRLEVTQFSVNAVSEDNAQVTAKVVAHTATRDVPMGSTTDPFFDLFVKEGGVWKVGDPSC